MITLKKKHLKSPNLNQAETSHSSASEHLSNNYMKNAN